MAFNNYFNICLTFMDVLNSVSQKFALIGHEKNNLEHENIGKIYSTYRL